MITLLATIVLLGVLVTVHELGHYIVAKLSNVKVKVFSVGFGKPFITWRRGETEYRISQLPLGGYVRLAGMDPAEPVEPDEVGRTFREKAPWVRMLIALGGPAMNLILPFVILLPLYSLSAKYDEVEGSAVGALDTGRPAYREGLREGDTIIEIDGDPVATFWQVVEHVSSYTPDQGPLKMKVRRPGVAEPVALAIHPEETVRTDPLMGFVHRQYKIGYIAHYKSATLSVVDPALDGPQAGLRTFDTVRKVGDTEVAHYIELQNALREAAPGQPLSLEVERARPLDMPMLYARERVTITLPPTDAPRTVESLGIGASETCLASVDPNGPAARATPVGHDAGPGLKAGDCITAVDGKPHSLVYSVYTKISHQPERAKEVTVSRDGAELKFTLAMERTIFEDPLAGEITQWRMGLSWLPPLERQVPAPLVENVDRLDFAWQSSVKKVSNQVSNTVRSIGGMFSGQVSPQQLSGPLTIGYLAGEYARAGFESFLHLMVVVSLSLALINLVPIPGLDGGLMLVAGVEMVIRRPLPLKVQRGLQYVGSAMILSLIVFALGNDFLKQIRLWSG